MDQRLAELIRRFPMSTRSDDNMTVLTCPVRLAFVSFKEPKKQEGSAKEARYSCAAIVPATADIEALKLAQRTAWETSPHAKVRGTPKSLAIKLQSTMVNRKDGKPYAGFGAEGVCFNCETKELNDLFDQNAAKTAADLFYSGCWARLRIRASAYDFNGNWGVKFWLQSAQFIADDEKFATGGNVADGFEPLAPAGNGPARMPGGAPALESSSLY